MVPWRLTVRNQCLYQTGFLKSYHLHDDCSGTAMDGGDRDDRAAFNGSNKCSLANLLTATVLAHSVTHSDEVVEVTIIWSILTDCCVPY